MNMVFRTFPTCLLQKLNKGHAGCGIPFAGLQKHIWALPCSLTFIMYVLPQMRAIGNIQRGIMAGKLKGAMPAQTPKGVLDGWTTSIHPLTCGRWGPCPCSLRPSSPQSTGWSRCTLAPPPWHLSLWFPLNISNRNLPSTCGLCSCHTTSQQKCWGPHLHIFISLIRIWISEKMTRQDGRLSSTRFAELQLVHNHLLLSSSTSNSKSDGRHSPGAPS